MLTTQQTVLYLLTVVYLATNIPNIRRFLNTYVLFIWQYFRLPARTEKESSLTTSKTGWDRMYETGGYFSATNQFFSSN